MVKSIKHAEIILKQVSDYLTDFLGFEYNLMIDYEELDNNEISKIGGVPLIEERKKNMIPYVGQHNSKIFELIEVETEKFLSSENIFSGNVINIINSIAINLIFDDFQSTDQIEKIKLQKFIKVLQDVSHMTYESELVKMGIFYCQTDSDLDNLGKIPGFQYIKTDIVNLDKFVKSQKPLLKLIDNKNFCLVVNKEFEVTGVIKRKFESKPIANIMNELIIEKEKYLFINDLINEILVMTDKCYPTNYCEEILKFWKEQGEMVDFRQEKYLLGNKDEIDKKYSEYKNYLLHLLKTKQEFYENEINKKMKCIDKCKYISIHNGEVEFWVNNYYSMCLKNSKWTVKNYVKLAHEIFVSLYKNPNYLLTDKVEKININIRKNRKIWSSDKTETKAIVKSIFTEIEEKSIEIFKLIDNMRSMSKKNKGALFIIITKHDYFKDYKDKLIENSDSKNKFKNSYKDLINMNGENINITRMNNDTLQLIASVDGAVLIDNNFNVLSFSEMIKSQEFDKKFCGEAYGARTNAAINSTKFGIGIKVSEDGDITAYREVLIRNEEDEIEGIAVKVLTI